MSLKEITQCVLVAVLILCVLIGIGAILTLVVGIAPECNPGYIYSYQERACIVGYKP